MNIKQIFIVFVAFCWSITPLFAQEHELSATEELRQLSNESSALQKKKPFKENISKKEMTKHETTLPESRVNSESTNSDIANVTNSKTLNNATKEKEMDSKNVSISSSNRSGWSIVRIISLTALLILIILFIKKRSTIMKWFYDMKISKKLIGSFSFLALIAAFIGYTGISNMSLMNENAKQMFDDRTVPLVELSNTQQELYDIRLAVANLVASKDNYEQTILRKAILDHEKKAEELMIKFEATNLNPEEKRLYAEYKKSWVEFMPIVDKAVELALGDNEEVAHKFEAGEFDQDAKRITEELDSLIASEEHLADSLDQEIASEYETASIEIYLVLVFGIAFAIFIGVFISNYLSKNLKQVLERMESLSGICITNLAKGSEQLSNGDLNINIVTGTKHLEINSKDEIGQLAEKMNKVITNTQGTVASVEKAVKAVKETVSEIDTIVNASVNGQLKTRGNTSKFSGSYKELVEGLNNTLEAVTAPINEQSGILEKMSSGDMTVRMTGDYKGDFQLIKNSINKMGDSVSGILNQVKEAVAATASAANQISSSTEQMAAGAQEQSSQATEVAGAVEEMTKTIVETTKNTAQATEASKNSGKVAREGGKVVEETIHGMNRIAEVVRKSADTVQELGKSSDQIGEIVQVIDDIADQTNLLALNAAIEAARAGEQGRGFAVVADEVRKLAERTTKATKEIATMIKQIQKDTTGAVESMEQGTKEVEVGKQLAEKAGTSLQEIIHGAEQVLDIVSQVAAASEEQSSAAEQISKNIESISSVTQESASGIQQIAHASEDLNRLTLNLQELIAQFKVDESGSKLAVRQNGKLVHI